MKRAHWTIRNAMVSFMHRWTKRWRCTSVTSSAHTALQSSREDRESDTVIFHAVTVSWQRWNSLKSQSTDSSLLRLVLLVQYQCEHAPSDTVWQMHHNKLNYTHNLWQSSLSHVYGLCLFESPKTAIVETSGLKISFQSFQIQKHIFQEAWNQLDFILLICLCYIDFPFFFA